VPVGEHERHAYNRVEQRMSPNTAVAHTNVSHRITPPNLIHTGQITEANCVTYAVKQMTFTQTHYFINSQQNQPNQTECIRTSDKNRDNRIFIFPVALMANFSIEVSDTKNSRQKDGVDFGKASCRDPRTLTDQSQIV